MEAAFGQDFGGVRAHLGDAAAREGLDALGARAAAHGDAIAFESASPSAELVAHELTHVVQQRQSGGTGPQGKATVSEPGDAAEQEADAVAARVIAGERVTVSATPGAGIHRDIKGSGKVPLGEFAIDMTKIENPAGKTGESGTVSFTPNDKAPDSKSIRLSQIVKTSQVSDKKDVDWATVGTGAEANRNKMMTTGADQTHVTVSGDTLKKLALHYYGDPGRHGDILTANAGVLPATTKPDDRLEAGKSLKIPNAVEGGYFIDHLAADPKAKQRTAKTDPEVPQDYVWPGEEALKNKHGKKLGATIEPAILTDFPGTGNNWLFNFQTVARSEDAGVYYGTIHWDFETNGGKVSKESFSVIPGVSETFRSALDEFNSFYKNKHTVMLGETLSSIAQKYYGDPNKWPDIFNANKDIIKDPDHIEPGWKLNIPGKSGGA
jgi:nucleoid-associated protein YgaU